MFTLPRPTTSCSHSQNLLAGLSHDFITWFVGAFLIRITSTDNSSRSLGFNSLEFSFETKRKVRKERFSFPSRDYQYWQREHLFSEVSHLVTGGISTARTSLEVSLCTNSQEERNSHSCHYFRGELRHLDSLSQTCRDDVAPKVHLWPILAIRPMSFPLNSQLSFMQFNYSSTNSLLFYKQM